MLADILILISLLLLLVASGFFSGSETALFSLTGEQRLALNKSGSMVGATIMRLLHETRALLITLLLGNMVINVLFFVLGTIELIRLERVHNFHTAAVAVLSLVPLVLLILFGEVFPKLIASRNPVGFSKLIALPMILVHRILTPLQAVLNRAIITPLARLIAPSSKPAQLSNEELELLLEQSQQRGIIDDHEEQLLQGVLGLSELKVRDVMTPRVDIKAFDVDDNPSEMVSLVESTQLSFIPTFEKDLDHLTGVVRAKDALLHRPKTIDELKHLVHEVTYVPEVQPLEKLLIHFRQQGTTIAIVVDEFGGTAGLVTLEDAVEELVGEIAGPYEPGDESPIQPVERGVWRVSGGLSVHDWADAFGSAGHVDGVNTAAGLVTAKLGRIPEVGDQTKLGNVEIEVDAIEAKRVTWLTIRLGHEEE